jgi:serine-type D-Ala-D-Ala carboxypeptidase/endopeptidase (penicillin-binding protein 4)
VRTLLSIVVCCGLAASAGAQTRSSARGSRLIRAAVPATPRPTVVTTAAVFGNELTNLLTAKTRNGTWGAMVVSITRGDTLLALNAGQQVLPASTMKLFTTALAFEHLGPTYQLSTDVLRDGAIGADGTLEGNLILRGGGDPGLSSRFVRGTPDAPMLALAQSVAASGIKRVKGDLIGDATAFEPKRVPDGWLSRYLEAGYAARVSALSLNENLVTVIVAPGGSGAQLTLQPGSTTIPVVNNVRLTAGAGARLSVRRLADGSVEARGTIGSRSAPRYYQLVVDDPALFTAGSLRAALAANGVVVNGAVKLGTTPPTATRVATLASPPLSHLAAVMNRESINHFAELLFRGVAHKVMPDRVGSAEASNQLLRRFMEDKVGASPSPVFAADGSGLSTLDRTTARGLVQLLAYAHRAPWSSDFHASLPVAGESELLRHRMRYTPAQGNLHAKTGTTNEVVALAGYVTAGNGEVLAFGFVYNGRDRWNARTGIDASGSAMAAFVRE